MLFNYPSAQSQSYRDGSEDSREQRNTKRKRQTLSCLEWYATDHITLAEFRSKRRKTKCDKSLPCGMCLGRGEPQLCQFEDGSHPPPHAVTINITDFQNLQARVAHLERVISHSTGISPVRLETYPASEEVTKPDDVESAATALEAMAAGGNKKRPGPIYDRRDAAEHASGALHDAADQHDYDDQSWPSIVDNTGDVRKKSAKWVRDMEYVMAAAPREDLTICLVDRFFDDRYNIWHCIHQSLFRQELAQLYPLLQSGKSILIDPAWLAFFFSVLCFACRDIFDANIVDDSLSRFGITVETVPRLLGDLFDAVQTALTAAQWLTRPQMRVLHAVILFIPASDLGLDLESLHEESVLGTEGSWMAVATGICKAMSLHQLGTSPNKMPPSDPMLPPNNPLLKRQLAVRVFNTVVAYDAVFSYFRAQYRGEQVAFNFYETCYTTEEPQNYSDEDMMRDPNAKPRPLDQITSVIWMLHYYRLARYWRRMTEQLRKTSNYPLDVLVEYDRQIREDHLAAQLLGMNPNLTDAQRRNVGFISCAYYGRTMRLHRPFLLRSHQDPAYRFSQTAAVTSAREIVKTSVPYLRMVSRKSWFMFAQHFAAVTILFIHALHHPDKTNEFKQEVRPSYEVFSQAAMSDQPFLVRVAGDGHKMIEAMLQVLDTPNRSAGSVAEILQSLAKNAAGSSVPPLAPLVTSNYNADAGAFLVQAPFTEVVPGLDSSANPFAIPTGEEADWETFFSGLIRDEGAIKGKLVS